MPIMQKENLAVFNLAVDLISGHTGEISLVDYVPQKTAVPVFPPADQKYFERVTPESQGISSAYIADFINELNNDNNADIHQLMILRHGKVITECAFAPYVTGIKHIEHSLSKSITGTAIGLLIDEGKLSLDTRVVDVFKDKVSLLNAIKLKNLTIRHLLTMMSGVSFNESGAISGNDWVSSYIDSPLHFNPGTKFEYNSMNSYMLSAVVSEITGSSMEEYLKKKLFTPLGISDYIWEKCPKGITKGGWGLFMLPEDVAKIGQLYLNRGLWEGHRILSAEWVNDATLKKTDPEKDDGDGYAYQIWTGSRAGSYEFNGMLEQFCIIYPDMDMIIVTNAGSREFFTLGTIKSIIRKYFEGTFSPSEVLSDSRSASVKLRSALNDSQKRPGCYPIIEYGGWGRIRKSSGRRLIHDIMEKLDGNKYEIKEKSTGLMPIMMQVFHNNFTDGISDIAFNNLAGKHILSITEGNKKYNIELAFTGYSYNILDFHEEKYLAACGADMASDEDKNTVIKLKLAFIEEACVRYIKIFFNENFTGVRIEMRETPGNDVILGALESVTVEKDPGFIMSRFKDMGALDIFSHAASTKIKPVLHGELCQKP